MTSAPAAGWYPDPTDQHRMRWWDGSTWSEQTQQLPAPAPAAPLLPPPSRDSLIATGVGPASLAEPVRKRLPLWAWIAIGVAALGVGILLSPIFTVLWLVVLITGIVALVKNTPTWLRFSNRGTAAVVTAIAAVCFLLTGSVANAMTGRGGNEAAPAASATPSRTPAAITPSPEPTEADEATEDSDADPVAFTGDASTVADTSSTDGATALEVLATLPVKGRAVKTGYDRNLFGQRWLDVDRNGCDTRNDILLRDLVATTRAGSCRVMTGILNDPFTGRSISFTRGQGTSELVQIDHVVALSDAWQKGAQQLTADQRATFANDPLNLLAVDGSANAQKGDGDAATWLPKNKSFRCAYVARQVAVKATYGLWVTQPEHDAIAAVLSACPDEPAPTSTFAEVAPEPAPAPVAEEPAPVPAPAAPVPAAPAPAAPAPPAPAPAAPAPVAPSNVYYENCTAVRAAGAAPIRAGEPGYTRKLDRDGDGVACE
ncbi:calcium-binding protein [Actinomycetales bacterium SN12]|nr:calcium-binding protein [Actinomycetales bacterium SN12]